MSINNGECAGQIIIGGMHGVGKTTLAEEIISRDGFDRLPSLSTRAPRNNTDSEYERFSRAELQEMMDDDELLNFDEVNGEVYAVRRSDFTELHENGTTPVKEIHPNNFHKLAAVCANTFPVVVTNEPFAERPNRRASPEDEQLGDAFVAVSLGKMAVDLTHFDSIHEAADHVLKGFDVEKKRGKDFPDARLIDASNEASYSKIAPVFVDNLRLTTRDFHEASAEYLTSLLSSVPSGSITLEVGAGSNWLAGAVDLSHLNMIHQESSDGMYEEYQAGQNMLHSPVRHMPLRTKSVDCVVGSLVDGMLYPQALLELSRVLKTQGRIIVTYPSRTWADETRNGARYAEFMHEGEKIGAHSFSPDREEIESLLTDVGIELTDFIDCGPAHREQSYYSPALFNAQGKLPDSVVSIAVGRKV